MNIWKFRKLIMKRAKISRSFVLLIIFFIMFSILVVRLFQLQIVNGEKYENNFILQTKREIVLSGARGNIYDRNGKPLAVNKVANSVTFEDQETYDSDRERQLNLNSKIYKMIRIIKSNGDEIENIDTPAVCRPLEVIDVFAPPFVHPVQCTVTVRAEVENLGIVWIYRAVIVISEYPAAP